MMPFFWMLTFIIAVVAFIRFPALRRHLGAAKATILLGLRLAAIFIALLLALPVTFPSPRKVTQPARIAILIDASQSADVPERQKALKALQQALRPHADAVTVWRFGSDVVSTPIPQITQRTAEGASRLSEAVMRVAETMQPDKLVIIADGQDTASQPDTQIIASLKRIGTQVIAIPLPANLPPNLQVSASPTRTTLFAGEEAKVTVQVSGQNLSKATAACMFVWEGRRLIQRFSVSGQRLTANPQSFSIRLRPDKSGWHRYRLEVVPLQGEKWTDDNAVEIAVWQAPTKLRVLLVCGHPTFEFKFVKQALEAEPNFEWAAVADLPDGTRYQQGTPALLPVSLQRLQPFHVFIALAPTPADFGSAEVQAVRQFVTNGGGLLVTLNPFSIQAQGWRLFVSAPFQLASLPSPAPLTIVTDDLLGGRLPKLPPVDAAWGIEHGARSERQGVWETRHLITAVESNGKPVLVWWQEGLGKIAFFAADGTWRWAMEAARKGEAPTAHRQFWRTLVRFLADPQKGANGEWRIAKGKRQIALSVPKPPPDEWTKTPQPERLRRWAEATGGKLLPTDEAAAWVRQTRWTKTVTVTQPQPLSAMPLPYLLLLAALTIEWWVIRRSGLP